jgi:hypothetical protein
VLDDKTAEKLGITPNSEKSIPQGKHSGSTAGSGSTSTSPNSSRSMQ